MFIANQDRSEYDMQLLDFNDYFIDENFANHDAYLSHYLHPLLTTFHLLLLPPPLLPHPRLLRHSDHLRRQASLRHHLRTFPNFHQAPKLAFQVSSFAVDNDHSSSGYYSHLGG